MKKISVKNIIDNLKASPFVLSCEMPLGYSAGFPILQVRKGEPLLVIPYLRHQMTGVVDKTLVYPIRFCVTVRARDGKIVGYQDLAWDSRFANVDFTKPTGLFRHEKIRHWNKQTYRANREELMALYGLLCHSVLAGESFPAAQLERMKELLGAMVEPCQLPVYQALDAKFYQQFLA